MAASLVDRSNEPDRQLGIFRDSGRSCSAGQTRATRSARAHPPRIQIGQPQHAETSVANANVSFDAVPATSKVRDHDDAQLIEAVRHGDVAAYGDLYVQHLGAARNLARQLARTTTEADDLVSEAFIRVLHALRAGGGPNSAIRAYLLTALRHVAYDRTRKERRIELSEDIVESVDPALVSVPFDDTVTATAEKALAKNAFTQLPERWQTVLWLTEVEGQTPAEVASSLGLTPNGVSALAYRAREGLRQAYLQAHLAAVEARRCRPTIEVLGAWTRNGLPRRQARQVELHLDECASCRALSRELAEVNSAFRVAPKITRRPTARGDVSVCRRASRQQPIAIGPGRSLLGMGLAS